jgi:hypothetical protein
VFAFSSSSPFIFLPLICSSFYTYFFISLILLRSLLSYFLLQCFCRVRKMYEYAKIRLLNSPCPSLYM